MSRVVALRKVLVPVKELISARLFWSKMLVESVVTFTLVTGKNGVVFTPALDPRYLSQCTFAPFHWIVLKLSRN